MDLAAKCVRGWRACVAMTGRMLMTSRTAAEMQRRNCVLGCLRSIHVLAPACKYLFVEWYSRRLQAHTHGLANADNDCGWLHVAW